MRRQANRSAYSPATVEQLFHRVAAPAMPPQRIVLECHLQVRESSGAHPAAAV